MFVCAVLESSGKGLRGSVEARLAGWWDFLPSEKKGGDATRVVSTGTPAGHKLITSGGHSSPLGAFVVSVLVDLPKLLVSRLRAHRDDDEEEAELSTLRSLTDYYLREGESKRKEVRTSLFLLTPLDTVSSMSRPSTRLSK
jgi:hypothetical protein